MRPRPQMDRGSGGVCAAVVAIRCYIRQNAAARIAIRLDGQGVAALRFGGCIRNVDFVHSAPERGGVERRSEEEELFDRNIGGTVLRDSPGRAAILTGEDADFGSSIKPL